VELTPAANNTTTELAEVYHYDHLGSIDCITPYLPARLATTPRQDRALQ